MFDFSNYSGKSKYYDNSNVLVVGKMIYKMGGVVIEEFFRLRPKMYSILKRDPKEFKITKLLNNNVVAKIRHNEYKYFLLNIKYLRSSMNRIKE